MRTMIRQEQRCLTGRIASTDDHDGSVRTCLRLHLSGGVVDADAFELSQPLYSQAVVARTSGDNHGTSRDDIAVFESDVMRVSVGEERSRPDAQLHSDTELHRL